MGDQEIEEKVDRWFDGLDLSSLTVLQVVFPGKELLKESLQEINKNAEKPITRGQLVAAISEDLISLELREFLRRTGAGQGEL